MTRLNGLNINDACEDVAKYFNGFTSPQEFVENCERGDWILWLFARTNPKEIQLIALVKGLCVNTVRHLMPDEKSIAAVDAAIAFGEGRMSTKQLDAYANDATDAAYAAYSYAANAAYAATAYAATAYADDADAAYAAYADAVYASYAYTDAAYANAAFAAAAAALSAAAADAAANDDYDGNSYDDANTAYTADARIKNQQETANICRQYLPVEIWNFIPRNGT